MLEYQITTMLRTRAKPMKGVASFNPFDFRVLFQAKGKERDKRMSIGASLARQRAPP
jgi:hypothetical protein